MQVAKTKKPKNGSQARKVYDYMLAGNTLTSVEAWEVLRILKLPNRINELRNKYQIEVYGRTHQKGKSRWQEYSLFPFEDG